MAVEYNISIDREEGLRFEFKRRTKDTHESLIPADAGARMIIRDITGISDPIELTTDNGAITLDADEANAVTILTRAQAGGTAIKHATYKWYLNFADGTRKKLFTGELRFV